MQIVQEYNVHLERKMLLVLLIQNTFNNSKRISDIKKAVRWLLNLAENLKNLKLVEFLIILNWTQNSNLNRLFKINIYIALIEVKSFYSPRRIKGVAGTT
jgi:hypothetical protein